MTRTLTPYELDGGWEFHRGECQTTHGPRGGLRTEVETWRRNGNTQTWKTRPDDFRVPVIHGMRDYGQIIPDNVHEFHLASRCPLHRVEYRRLLHDGRVIEVSKHGGGTLGRRYTGDWEVTVYDRRGDAVFDEYLHTPLPSTHAEADDQAFEFLDSHGI